MVQRAKIIRSRDEWKRQAVQRADDIREHRKTLRRYRQKIAQLKAEISVFEQQAEEKNEPEPAAAAAAAANLFDLAEARHVRTFRVLPVLQAVVSCRSVPRILDRFRTRALLDLDRVPHFTSVINWTLRVGPGLLRQVAAITEPRVAIVDHSIDIGTKKALVVLRVPLAALSRRGAAIHLADCGCVGPTIADTVDGETVARHLEAIFDRSGAPAAITKDCDATLQEGVRLWMEKAQVAVPVIEDIGHVTASALKARFEQTSAYQRFTTPAAEAAKSLRQTEPAFLVPPQLRTKGWFLSIGKLARWGEKMLGVPAVEGRAEKGSLPAKLRATLPGFLRLRAFVETFASIAVTVSRVMEQYRSARFLLPHRLASFSMVSRVKGKRTAIPAEQRTL